MSIDFFSKGIKHLNSATAKDESGELGEALRLYMLSFEYFISGLKYSKNDKVNQTIKAKLKEFMGRAEQIKKAIAEHDGKQKTEKGKEENKAKDETTPKKKDEETTKLRKQLEDTVVKEKPKLTWKDIAGLESAKQALEEAVILPQKFPQMFTGKRKAWKGILLYGPPGTGKTLLAKATAGMTNATFFAVSSSDLVSKWQGESEKLIRELFDLAKENKPSIVFIDEIDAICGQRTDDEHDATRRIKTEFLVQMNKILDEEGVLVLGATNRPFDLDPAVRRRFEKRIYIPLPDEVSRTELLKIHLGNEEIHVDKNYIHDLSKKTEGYSGSDLAILIRDVLMAPVRQAMKSTHWKQIPNPHQDKGGPQFLMTPCSPEDPGAKPMSLMDLTGSDELLLPEIKEENFEKALGTIKPSVSKKDLEMQEKFTQMYGISGVIKQPTPEEVAQQKEDERKMKEEQERLEKEELELMKRTTELTNKYEEEKKQRKEEKKRKKDDGSSSNSRQPAMA